MKPYLVHTALSSLDWWQVDTLRYQLASGSIICFALAALLWGVDI